MNQHDNLSQTLFVFGLIKQVQLTLLHCLIVFGFRRYSPLTGILEVKLSELCVMCVHCNVLSILLIDLLVAWGVCGCHGKA